MDGSYIPISPNADGGIYSEVLGLEFRLRDMECGIYDPVSEVWLQTPAEAAETSAETAETRAENAEAEIARLREQLTRLRARS